MMEYLIYFNQQWVGDHSAEWFQERGVLARRVVHDMQEAGVLVFADGLEEDVDQAFFVDPTSGALQFGTGPFAQTEQFLGGMTIINVDSDEVARFWAEQIALACGWPQEVRRYK